MNKINLNPFADRIIAREIKESTTTPGGIIIPSSVQQKKLKKVEIVAVGPGKLLPSGEHKKMDVGVGDVVAISSHSGYPIKVEGEDYLLVEEDAVLGIVE